MTRLMVRDRRYACARDGCPEWADEIIDGTSWCRAHAPTGYRVQPQETEMQEIQWPGTQRTPRPLFTKRPRNFPLEFRRFGVHYANDVDPRMKYATEMLGRKGPPGTPYLNEIGRVASTRFRHVLGPFERIDRPRWPDNKFRNLRRGKPGVREFEPEQERERPDWPPPMRRR